MNAALTYLLSRMAEPSTQRGLLIILSGAAYGYDPARFEAIITVSSIALGAVEVYRKELGKV